MYGVRGLPLQLLRNYLRNRSQCVRVNQTCSHCLKGKVVYGQEPPSAQSTTTECGVNCQLLAVITEVTQWGTPSCSRPQPAADSGVRDVRSNCLVAPLTLMDSIP